MIIEREATAAALQWLQTNGRGFEYRHVSTRISANRGWIVVIDVFDQGDLLDGPLVLLVSTENGEVSTTYP